MYLFWKRNALGGISLSTAGMGAFIRGYLRKPFECDHITLYGREDSLVVVLSCPRGEASPAMDAVEGRVKEALADVGLPARVSWVEVEKAPFDLGAELRGLLKKPITWALIGAGVGALATMGFKPFLWTVFWGAAFYFVTVFLLSERCERIFERFKRVAGR